MEEQKLVENDSQGHEIDDLVPDLSQAQPLVRILTKFILDTLWNFRKEVDQEISINEASPPPMGEASWHLLVQFLPWAVQDAKDAAPAQVNMQERHW